MNSLEEIRNLPIGRSQDTQINLRNVADITQGTVLGEYDRYNMQRMVTLGANLGGEDMGRVADRVSQAIEKIGPPPQGVSVALRGQVVPMREMFSGLELGLVVAVIAIFLLLAANFQSFRLSFAIMLTIPSVIAGVAVALRITGTTLNIQSLMGAVMAIGVAVANAILLVTFAERSRIEGAAAVDAAIAGAAGRLRPILMTSFAMIGGMLPMAVGLGDGGSQTAPLGRAVVGGLSGATFATLVVLPAVFAILQGNQTRRSVSLHPEDRAGFDFRPEKSAGATAALQPQHDAV
jgi:multidrug efflux pump subunit AcrB